AVRPASFNGQSTVTYNGFPADLVSSKYVNKAYLYGWNAQVRADLSTQWAVTASYNYTYGRMKVDGGPDALLDHIPPQFGRAGISYSNKNLLCEWFTNFSGK